MVLSAAERSRAWRQRQKNDQLLHASYLQKERERYQARKKKGEIKLIHDLPKREQRLRRRKWRMDKRQYRNEKKAQNATAGQILNATPPNTPSPAPSREINRLATQYVSKKPGRKQVRKDRAKAYHKIEKLNVALYRKTKLANKYKQRLSRLSRKGNKCMTPRSKTNSMLKDVRGNVPKGIKRTLLFHNSLIADLKESYAKRKTDREKQLFTKTICGKVMKKYRQISTAKSIFGCSRSLVTSNMSRSESLVYERKISTKRLSQSVEKQITDFFVRDDNSRMTAGKKETVTRNKQKKQKRFLLDSMKNLHQKFVSENQKMRVSYSTFLKRRPFWVVVPRVSDRETCVCKLCDNLELKASILQANGVLTSSNLDTVAQELCCRERKDCMYRTCDTCKSQTLATPNDIDYGKQISWMEWKVVKEERRRSPEDTFEVTVTKKVEQSGSLEVLKDEFMSTLLEKGCRHIYNIKHQYRAIKTMKESLNEHEAALHIDFAENYGCKLHREVQAMHFGASKSQVTIHNGVVYTRDKTLSFATLSGSTRHDPSSIWTFMSPVFGWLQNVVPGINCLHFISDGPSTQYKCRKNFHLFSNKLFHLIPSLTKATWSFLCAGHGKGAADGVGGYLKRSADKLVANGQDLHDAPSVFHALRDASSNVKLFFVDEGELAQMDAQIPEDLPPVKNIMRIHQVMMSTPGTIQHREVSCYCSRDGFCNCYAPSSTILLDEQSRQIQAPDPLNANTSVRSHSIQRDTHVTDRAVLESRAHASSSGPLQPVVEIDTRDIGKYCVVVYDGLPYPGTIVDIDETDSSVEVNAMCRIGENRYFWPSIEDRLWYTLEKVITIIPKPQQVTKRHVAIDKEIYSAILKKLDISC